jgi:hypothetical protein
VKLKTERHETHGYPVFFYSPLCDVQHDAAAAHALLIAMGEADPDSDYRLGTELQHIRARADEILAEWGYRED